MHQTTLTIVKKNGTIQSLLFSNCLKISHRENMLAKMSNNKLCFVPYGTKDVRIFIHSTDLTFLTEQEN